MNVEAREEIEKPVPSINLEQFLFKLDSELEMYDNSIQEASRRLKNAVKNGVQGLIGKGLMND